VTLEVALRHRMGAFALDARFAAPPGVTVLFGRSGAGKTTVVEAVAGLLRPEEGRVAVGGRLLLDTARGVFVPPHKRRVGYVFQDARLFPHRSVRGNLLYGRRRRRGTTGADTDAVISMLGLAPLLGRRPRDLSGGERQRVAIGRALLSDPELLLADEPLAALDAPRKAEILPYLERLRDALAIPILYVTHQPAEVARLATTVVALEEGRVVAAGEAGEVLADPRVTPLGAREAGAVLTATVTRHHEDGLTELAAGGHALWVAGVPAAPGARVRLRVAAGDVILARGRPDGLSALNVLPGRIERIRAGEGPGTLVSLHTPAGPLLARVTRRSAAALGLMVGGEVHAVVKTLSIAPADVGG
jgi:molybdate transport system ATP-binding protein